MLALSGILVSRSSQSYDSSLLNSVIGFQSCLVTFGESMASILHSSNASFYR